MQRLNEYDQPIGPELAGWIAPVLPPRVVLSGRFCRVEPLDVERHGRELFEGTAGTVNERNFTYLPYGPFERTGEYLEWLQEAQGGEDPSFFVIVTANDGRASGLASYMRIQPQSGSIEVGHLNYSPRLQRTPAATEAMFLMMKNAFSLGYRRYEWKCDALNAPSRAAAERLGFSFEGIFRQATVYKNRNRDTAWYSVIDAEWPALERAFSEWLDPSNFDEVGVQRSRLGQIRTRLWQARASNTEQ